MSNDRQLPSETEITAAVASRNALRRQSGLPPRELQDELDRHGDVQQHRAFRQCMRSPLRYRAEQKLLLRMRRRFNNPAWQPTGVLSGGGWAFHSLLVKHMQKLIGRLASG